MRWLVPLGFDPLPAQTPEEAAEPALRMLLAEDFEGVTGALFSKVRTFKRVAPGARVPDPGQGRRLWELSERMTARALALAGVGGR
jgi:hypothetical protein